MAGKVQKALFNKMGTLTKKRLGFLSARSANNWQLSGIEEPMGDSLLSMACCHTLVVSKEGYLIRNAVDKIMFDACSTTITKKLYIDNVKIWYKIGRDITVLKKFEFNHQWMSYSVIVQYHDKENGFCERKCRKYKATL